MEEVKGQGGETLNLSQEEKTKVIELLNAMTPEQKAQWIEQQGSKGVLLLLEAEKELMNKKFEEIALSERKAILDGLVEEWAERNKEILENEEVEKLARGLDLALLQEKGYNSYVEMTPAELRKHLEEVGELTKRYLSASPEGKREGKKEEAKEKEEKKDDKIERGATHIGDISGGGGDLKGVGDITLDTLASKTGDPIEFESLVGKLDDNTLVGLLKQVEA